MSRSLSIQVYDKNLEQFFVLSKCSSEVKFLESVRSLATHVRNVDDCTHSGFLLNRWQGEEGTRGRYF